MDVLVVRTALHRLGVGKQHRQAVRHDRAQRGAGRLICGERGYEAARSSLQRRRLLVVREQIPAFGLAEWQRNQRQCVPAPPDQSKRERAQVLRLPLLQFELDLAQLFVAAWPRVHRLDAPTIDRDLDQAATAGQSAHVAREARAEDRDQRPDATTPGQQCGQRRVGERREIDVRPTTAHSGRSFPLTTHRKSATGFTGGLQRLHPPATGAPQAQRHRIPLQQTIGRVQVNRVESLPARDG